MNDQQKDNFTVLVGLSIKTGLSRLEAAYVSFLQIYKVIHCNSVKYNNLTYKVIHYNSVIYNNLINKVIHYNRVIYNNLIYNVIGYYSVIYNIPASDCESVLLITTALTK